MKLVNLGMQASRGKSVGESPTDAFGEHLKKKPDATKATDFTALMESLLLPTQPAVQVGIHGVSNKSKADKSNERGPKLAQLPTALRQHPQDIQLSGSKLSHAVRQSRDELLKDSSSQLVASKVPHGTESKGTGHDEKSTHAANVVRPVVELSDRSALLQKLGHVVEHQGDSKPTYVTAQASKAESPSGPRTMNVGKATRSAKSQVPSEHFDVARTIHEINVPKAAGGLGWQLSETRFAVSNGLKETGEKTHVGVLSIGRQAGVLTTSSQKPNLNVPLISTSVVPTSPAVMFTNMHAHVQESPTLNVHHVDASEQFGRIISAQVAAGANQIQVKVHPEGMGDLVISVSRMPTGLQVHVEANQMATMQWLGQQTQLMMNAMQQSGLNIAGVQLSFGQADLSNFKQSHSGKRDGESSSAVRAVGKSEGRSEQSESLDSSAQDVSDGSLSLRI